MKVAKLFGFFILFFSLRLSVQAQVNFTSSNLPIIVIETQGQTIPDEPKITADMGIIDNGPGLRNQRSGPYNEYNGKIGIEIRGSSSTMFPKKQYALETRDSLGNNLNISLLGMPPENDWILYAPYSDKSLIRNVLAYALSNDIGRYTSRTRFCELVLNGDYRGVYVWMEKIKNDKNRLDLKNVTAGDTSGIDLTGGYILKIDKSEGSEIGGWESQFPPFTGAWQKIFYQYHDPKPSEILPVQEQYIQDFIWNFELTMYSQNYDHPFDGYYDIVNLESLVDHFILNELGKNVDAYRLSAFLYKDRDDVDARLTAGPIWDFNLAFGNADYYRGWETEGWQLMVSIDQDYWQNPFWWKKLKDEPVFANRLARRWHELRQNRYRLDSLYHKIDIWITLLEESQQRNFERWPILGSYVWPNAFVGDSYPEEIEYLKNWLQDRMNWMDVELGTEYAVVDWASPESVLLTAPVNTVLMVPVETFAHSNSRLDSITFVSADSQLYLDKKGDSLRFTATREGEFNFKGLGWQNGSRVELSPAYSFHTGTSGMTHKSNGVLPSFILRQNYPNPFNAATRIPFTLNTAGRVALSIFDVNGEIVSKLVDASLPAGNHQYLFNAANLSSGVYFYSLQMGNRVSTRKLIILK